MAKNNSAIDFSPDAVPLRRTVWLIYGAALAALLVLLGRNALVGTEGDLAESVRQFAAGRDLFHTDLWQPDSAAALVVAKISSWLAALTGVSELSVRLPAVAAAVLMLAGTMRLTGTFFDSKTAFTAGWLLIGSYGFLYWGRNGSWFIMPGAAVVWSAVLFAAEENRFRNIFTGTLVFTVSALLWGWYFLLPALPAAVMLLPWRGSDKGFLRTLFLAAALSLFIAAGGMFFIIFSPSETLSANAAALGRLLDRIWTESFAVMIFPGKSAWYKGLENLPRILIPWIPLTFAAIYGMIHNWRELDDDVKKLLLCTAATALLIGILPGKRWQFVISALPFLIAVTAGGIAGDKVDEKLNKYAGWVMQWGCALLGALAAALAVTYPLWDLLLKVTPPLGLMTLVPAMGVVALGLLIFDTGSNSAEERISGMRGAWSGYVLAAVVLGAALWCVMMPLLTKFRAGRPFWKKCGTVSRTVMLDRVIFFNIGADGDKLFYLGGKAVCPAQDAGDLKRYLENVDSAAVVLRAGSADDLRRAAAAVHWQVAETPDVCEGAPLRLLGEQEQPERRYVLYKITRIP